MKKRKPLKEAYDCTLTINWSGWIVGDGVLTMTPNMMIDKAMEPFDHALANHYIRDFKYEVKVNNLREARAMVAKSKKGY
jgi:hypothetical protein